MAEEGEKKEALLGDEPEKEEEEEKVLTEAEFVAMAEEEMRRMNHRIKIFVGVAAGWSILVFCIFLPVMMIGGNQANALGLYDQIPTTDSSSK